MNGKELRELAIRVEEQWKDDPNVIGVGFGFKHRQGKRVGGPALRFTVRSKYPTDEAIRTAGSSTIPDEIEGVATDVNVVETTADGTFWAGKRGRKIQEPLRGGVAIAPLSGLVPIPTSAGTLGAVCFYNDDGRLMALSNAHVLGNEIGCDVIQPQIPTTEIVTAEVEVLACGPLAYVGDPVVPSGLTGILAGATAASWYATTLADQKDPHRRGQEATVPELASEKTIEESVEVVAQSITIVPLPGTPYQADVSWDYVRRTDESEYPFAIANETMTNEHTLIRKTVWMDQLEYPGGKTVEIMALLEAKNVDRPDAFHVVAHLTPEQQPERRESRVLHPAECPQTIPWLCVGFAGKKKDSVAKFPFSFTALGVPVSFNSDSKGIFRDKWPISSPDGQIELEFPDEGLEIKVPPTSLAEAHVVLFNSEPVILEAYDSDDELLDTATVGGPKELAHVLRVRGKAIARLVLRGGGGNSLLLFVCLRLEDKEVRPAPIDPDNRIFCYRGTYALDPSEPKGAWRVLLTAQTVNTAPLGTPPLKAAEKLGGVHSAGLLALAAPCVLVMLLDHAFDVI